MESDRMPSGGPAISLTGSSGRIRMVGTTSASGVEGGEVLREAPEADVVIRRFITNIVNYRQVSQDVRDSPGREGRAAGCGFVVGACVLGSARSVYCRSRARPACRQLTQEPVLDLRLVGVAAAVSRTGCPLFSCRHQPEGRDGLCRDVSTLPTREHRCGAARLVRSRRWWSWGLGRGLRFRWG